jgi:hypothetical protein
MRRFPVLGLSLSMCVLVGCGAAEQSDNAAGQSRVAKEAAAGAPKQVAMRDAEKHPAREPDKGGENQPAAEPIAHKIIYTGHMDLTVETYEKATTDLKALAKKVKGYVANSDDSGRSGAQRVGTYTVRVPVDSYETFLDDVAQLGEVQRRTSDTQDITDQFYDLDTRIKNDKVREESLLKLYNQTLAEKSTAADRIQLTNELFNLRRSIEEQEGRLRRWDKETSYSTVVVHLEQRKDYTPAGTPGFGTTVARTWGGSLDLLSGFGKGLVLVAVALAPWLGVSLVVVVPAAYLLWRLVRHSRTTKPLPPSSPPPQAEPPLTAQPA